MTRALLLVCILLAGAAVGAGFALGGVWFAAAGVALVSIAWLGAELRGWGWAAHLGFLLFIFAAGAGIFFELGELLFIAGAVLTLAGWDLSAFQARLRLAAGGDDTARLETRHLAWLGVVSGAGFLLILAAQWIRLPLTFGWGALLAVVTVTALSQLVTWLKKRPA